MNERVLRGQRVVASEEESAVKGSPEGANRGDQIATRNLEHILNDLRVALFQIKPVERNITFADFADELIAERDLRSTFIDIDYNEAAWDMLIDLFRAEERRKKISVSSLALASRVPMTTALRYIADLKRRTFIEVSADPTDRRRVYVCLTDQARRSLKDYLVHLASRRRILLSSSEIIG